MSITNTTKTANRYGIDWEFYAYKGDGKIDGEPLAKIPFANETSIELSSDLVWATGGQAHANMISFIDPIQGTLKFSTQIITMQLMNLVAGNDIKTASNEVVFTNSKRTGDKYYIARGKTVRQGEDGVTYSETITAYKVCVKPSWNATYNGSGDPQSLDVEFELGTNDLGVVVKILHDDEADVVQP